MKRVVKRIISVFMAVVMMVSVMSGFMESGEVKAYNNATITHRETSGKIMAGVHTMGVVADDGHFYTWGRTYYPQSFIDEYTIASTIPTIPIQAQDIENMVSGTMGYDSQAMLLEDKSLYTWGRNFSYMCGNDTNKASGKEKIMENVRSVSMGDYTTLIVTEKNELYGCGQNANGELGLGDMYYAKVPTKIMDNVKVACAGALAGAAITVGGDLYVWGKSKYGWDGVDTTRIYTEPKKIDGLKDVIEVSVGLYTIAAITKNGDLYTWGYDELGALGNRRNDKSYEPEKIMENVKSVCMGFETGAAITEKGDLYTWGSNEYGGLGQSKDQRERLYSNVPVKIMSDVVEMAWGHKSGIALTSDDNVWTWGLNAGNCLGIGNNEIESSSVPRNVFNLVTGRCSGKKYVLRDVHEFNYNKDTYNQELAEDSALYAMLAYDNYRMKSDGKYFAVKARDNKSRLLINMLNKDGFNNTHSLNYTDDDQHNCSYTISNRLISYNGKERTQILVAIRGTDNEEWEGNMKLTGTEYNEAYKDTHYSFELAKEHILKGINVYLSQLEREGYDTTDCVFWLTGHSRGGAVANLLAADLTDKQGRQYGDVFAYTYATANATNKFNHKSYSNIFNHCFVDDFVPSVPLSVWGYGNYGTTFMADADVLYSTSAEFNEGMKEFVNSCREDNEADFDSEGTRAFLRYLQGGWSDTVAYYRPEKVWLDGKWKEDSNGSSLYMFMNDAIAKLAQGKISKMVTAELYFVENIKLTRVLTFFVSGQKIHQNINDTHQAYTYYLATKLKLFNKNTISTSSTDIAKLSQDIDSQALSMDLTKEENSLSHNSIETDIVSANSISINTISANGVSLQSELLSSDVSLLNALDEKQRLLDFMKSGDNADNFTWNENDTSTWEGLTFDEEGYILEINLDFMELSGNLNLSDFGRLQTLSCMGNNLDSINVSDCVALEEIDCSYNTVLSKLILSGCNSVKSISCEMNNIEEMNLSDCINLYKLRCGNNQISTLDLSACTQLKTLMCKSNLLSNILFPTENNLTRINCENNYLTDFLELEVMSQVKDNVILYKNQNVPKGSTFSESEVEQLRSFATTKQNLEKLGWDLDKPEEWFGIEWTNVDGVYHISRINLNNCKLEGSFIIDGYHELLELQISENTLNSVEIINCPKLQRVNCVQSGTETLIISDCKVLSEIYAYYNYITDEQLSIIEQEYNEEDNIVELYPQYVKASEEEFAKAELKTIRDFMNLEHNKECVTIDENPGHWDFVKWEMKEDGLYHIVDISLEWLWVTGKLNLSTLTYLSGIDCANSSITEIILPENLNEIPNRAFYNCDMLTKIIIPKNVTKIGRSTFADCNNLTIVSFLNKNSTIAENAFYKSVRIQTIECYSLSSESSYKYDTTPKFIYWDIKNDNEDQTNQNTNNTNDNSDNKNKTEDITALPKKGAKYIISGGIYKITKSSSKNGTVAYIGAKNKKAKTVTIPATIKINGVKFKVTAIHSNACKSMAKLQTVTIGNNVTTIGTKAFYNCKKLKKVTIGKNVKTIKANAFANCNNLKTVKMNSKVLKSIGKNAFKGIYKKATITVPKSKKATYKKLLTKKAVKMPTGIKIK